MNDVNSTTIVRASVRSLEKAEAELGGLKTKFADRLEIVQVNLGNPKDLEDQAKDADKVIWVRSFPFSLPFAFS